MSYFSGSVEGFYEALKEGKRMNAKDNLSQQMEDACELPAVDPMALPANPFKTSLTAEKIQELLAASEEPQAVEVGYVQTEEELSGTPVVL